jgi:lysophospholipase L1-like esterase
MTTKLKSGEKVLFIGDSITDCGRRNNGGTLGDGYVRWFDVLLTLREPHKQVAILNKGISGDRVTGLQQRWADDVLPAYIKVVHHLSRRYRTRLIETHAVYQRLLKYRAADTFCGEPVHPNQVGHVVIAEAVYAALSK